MHHDFDSMTDEEIALMAQQGDIDASEYLLNKYKNFVRSKARSYFLVGADHEDIVQEGMIGLYEAIVGYDGSSSFRTFASLCVQRRIIDAVKSATRLKNRALNTSVSIEESALEAAEDPELAVIDGENKQEFLQLMGRILSAFEFQVVVLYMDGLSAAEIAASLSKPYKSVDNALQRAKNKLRKEIR